jgi:hypothetical protein
MIALQLTLIVTIIIGVAAQGNMDHGVCLILHEYVGPSSLYTRVVLRVDRSQGLLIHVKHHLDHFPVSLVAIERARVEYIEHPILDVGTLASSVRVGVSDIKEAF